MQKNLHVITGTKISIRTWLAVVIVGLIVGTGLFTIAGLSALFIGTLPDQLKDPIPPTPICANINTFECLEYCGRAENALRSECQNTCVIDSNSSACIITCVKAPTGEACNNLCDIDPTSYGCGSACKGAGDGNGSAKLTPTLIQKCQNGCEDPNSEICIGYCSSTSGGPSQVCQDTCDAVNPNSTYTPAACSSTCTWSSNTPACANICATYSAHPLCNQTMCKDNLSVSQNPDTCKAACSDTSNPNGSACRAYCNWASSQNIIDPVCRGSNPTFLER